MNELPRAIEAEMTVLGSCMMNPKDFNEVRDILAPETFYDPRHGKIYEAILTIYRRGDRADALTVNNELKKSGTDMLMYLIEVQNMSTSYSLYQHAAIIHDKAIRRKFFTIAKELERNAYSEENDIFDVVAETREKMDGLFIDNTENVLTMPEAVKELVEQMNKNASSDTVLTGMPTMFDKFDKRSGGLQKSDLVIIAGETSQGKTSLALTITSNVAAANYPCAIYSLEMSAKQLTARLTAFETSIPSNVLLYFPMSEKQFITFDSRIQRLCNKPIFIDKRSTANIDTIISSIRVLNAKYGIQLFVIDYLQLLSMHDKKMGREEKTAEAARLLKNIAVELDVCVIALSQLARDKENPVPSIARLRNSGQIEEAADTIILVYRPEVYGRKFPEPFQGIDTKGTAYIDVAKGRNIGTFKFLAGFSGETTSFFNMETFEEAKEPASIMPF